MQNSKDPKLRPQRQRIRTGSRTPVACLNCKERKLKCDDRVPACANCQRFGLVCLVEDPATKRHQPRNYLEMLEERVAFLETILHQVPPGVGEHLSPDQMPDGDGPPSLPPGLQPTIEQVAEEDGVSDLSSKVGMLDLNAPGSEPHYMGSSSAFAFSRVVASSLRQVGRMTGTRSTTRDQEEGPTLLPAPSMLPDYESGRKLSDVYFKHIHPQYPFLHEATFRLWEQNITKSLDPLDASPVALFFLNIVYAVGALLLPECGYSPQGLYVSAQLYLDHVLPFDNLEAIQAILCCTMYSIRSATGPSVWKLSGLALRLCIELGYHRNTHRLGIVSDPLRRELRKRVFWCAYGIDSAAAVLLGRPLGIAVHEVDVEFPLDIDDSDLDRAVSCGVYPQSVITGPTSMSRAIHVFRLRLLWARIYTDLYSDPALSNPTHPTYLARVAYLRTQLDSWRESTPPPRHKEGEGLTVFASDDWFQLTYDHSILLLYRGQITDRKGAATFEIFLQSLQASERVCQAYRRQYLGRLTGYTWGALYLTFLAGLTYLHCLWTSPAAREATRQDQVSSVCTNCTIVLVTMAERYEAAAPYRDIFEALARSTMTMMVNKHHGQWLLPPAGGPTEPDGPDSEDLMQWMAEIVEPDLSYAIDSLLTGFIGDAPTQEPQSTAVGPW